MCSLPPLVRSGSNDCPKLESLDASGNLELNLARPKYGKYESPSASLCRITEKRFHGYPRDWRSRGA